MIKYITPEISMINWSDRRKIEKKVLPEYYKGIMSHKKMFEIRKDEDEIEPGDILVLREWDGSNYTGHIAGREVTAVLRDCPEYGLMPGYVILSLQVPGWDAICPQQNTDVPDTKVGDLISRQAAIDALAKHEKSKGHNYTMFVDVVSECAEIIRDLPPVQPEPQWIPCSEERNYGGDDRK